MLNTQTQYIIVSLFFIISFTYCILIPDKYFPRSISKLHKSCIMNCNNNQTCQAISSKRGGNYYIGYTENEDKKKLDNCFLTFWNVIHFLSHFLLGYFAPNVIWLTLTGTSIFELYEYIVLDCADFYDLPMNIIGIISGSFLSKNI